MVIFMAVDGRIELREADEFRSFKIVADGVSGPAALTAALHGLATVEPDGKTAWVSREAVRRLRGADAPPTWLAAFDKMVESVRRFGWVDDARNAVRAHIESAPA